MKKLLLTILVMMVLVPMIIYAETFGETSAASNNWAIGADEIWATKFTLTEDGTVTSMSFYGRNGVGGSQNMKMGIYSDNSGPDVLLGTSDEAAVSLTIQWWNFNFSSPLELTAGDYWLSGHMDGGPQVFYFAGDVGQTEKEPVVYTGTLPSTFPTSPDETASQRTSMYATYTPTEAPAASNQTVLKGSVILKGNVVLK